jgi:hypothetical protein
MRRRQASAAAAAAAAVPAAADEPETTLPEPVPAFPPCELKNLAWAELFGVKPRSVAGPEGRRDLCRAVSRAIPLTARYGYHVYRLLNRGAYGVVFAAYKKPGEGERAAAEPQVPWAALKVQFVCPAEVVRSEERRRCAAFGQRASPYDVVRYEAMQHERVHQVLRAAAADPTIGGRLAVPSVPIPLGAQRMVIGRRGEYRGVPPDGRRRLWISLMEFMEGRSVRQTMHDARRRRTLTLEAFRGVVVGVGQHLRVLHGLGLTHGDLHSGNVLIDEARAAVGRPWVVLVDLERSIPRDFFAEAPLAALGLVDAPEEAEVLWDAARLWDLKIFIESVIRLAEGVGAYEPSEGDMLRASGSSSPASRRSSASMTTPRQRFRRAAALARDFLRAYVGGDEEAARWYESRIPLWVARGLWLKRNPSAALPEEVVEEVRGAGWGDPEIPDVLQAVLAADRREHRAFFRLLRAVQGFYTGTGAGAGARAIAAGARIAHGLDPGAILPGPEGGGPALRRRVREAAPAAAKAARAARAARAAAPRRTRPAPTAAASAARPRTPQAPKGRRAAAAPPPPPPRARRPTSAPARSGGRNKPRKGAAATPARPARKRR